MKKSIKCINFREKWSKRSFAKNCIVCGHCVAICPREAIDNKRILLSNQISTKDFQKLSSEEAKNFLNSRRLIRSYKETSVSREKLINLVDIAHFASIGSNLQGYLI
ncbi:TPA: hypothetical protein PTV74_003645 [Clostridium botulinum]|uniref:hypothetical protein n=1 Tax=Clostridium botulinum TaxID=1491 RepID=UPI000D0D1F18|nr:hypothetical protein [Clostridium botulinum]PSL96471.1 hypothetical protein C6C12_18600 [Clostridium botulinum]HDK7139764.1 hypothetical protein [Clostridium botulinum]HDK7143348.1 hypothetical protein [Clostridium botulinum]HDK7146744.1 hypothetical protein [Clostridium botulinum]HDK7150587.1 hypothetical protein [Clostridium botulinum]